MKTHIKIIIGQAMLLIIVIAGVYFVYPRANVDVNGNFVNINSINAKVIVISENPDFTNSRYIETEKVKNISFDLKPGTYYWKSDNGIVEGFRNEFTIDSRVAMKINRSENESDLVNVGNVRINISKGKDGVMVGRIILDTGESEEIEDKNESYTGRQE